MPIVPSLGRRQAASAEQSKREVVMSAWGVPASFVLQLPVLMVWAAAALLAIVRWKGHPTVSLLLLAGLLVYACAALGDWIGNRWLLLGLGSTGPAVPRYVVAWAMGLGLAVMRALAWGLLFAAVFGWRDDWH
jgi:hypothetical protein